MQEDKKLAIITFTITKGEEIIFSTVERSKLTRGSFAMTYSGDIEGESVLEELKHYTDDALATVYGLERVKGRLGDKTGSFVFERTGHFVDGILTVRSVIIPGSATGDLKGLRGEVDFVSGSKSDLAHTFSMSMNYYFENGNGS